MAELNIQPKGLTTPNVHKFGGSSLKDAEKIAQVIDTIKTQVSAGDVLVVSANGQVTDLLLSLVNGQQQSVSPLRNYVTELISSVLTQPDTVLAIVEQDIYGLEAQLGQQQTNPNDWLAYGELWSAQLLSAVLHEHNINNQWLDARNLFEIDQQNHLANKLAAQNTLLKAAYQSMGSEHGQLQIVTGYIARDLLGQTVTLGRNGSDYTATLIADLLDSATVYLWTDVDGVYTADPNVITEARRIEQLSIAEAQALSELGSNVLHQKTIAPILQKTTQMVINTCAAVSVGTQVENNKETQASIVHNSHEYQVKTLAHKANLAFFSVVEVDELKARQFQAQLTAEQINNYANHYDKTRHVLSFYVEPIDLFATSQLIKQQNLTIKEQYGHVSLVSVVGQHIRQNHQVISKILNRSAQFEIHNIHYPANDHTLCVLLPDAQANQLLEDLHHTFFGLEPSIPIVVLGYGNIGQQFLKILKNKKAEIERQVKQSLSLVAVANSRYFQFDEHCLLGQNIELNQPNQQGEVYEILQKFAGKPMVIIDLTASELVAKQYLQFAEQGWHLISANKVAAADHQWAKQVEATLYKRGRLWQKNTTVGAALPIQSAIKGIRDTGDQIRQVSGILSGSLSWLFGQFDGSTKFMDWVKLAHQQALTEPDPRDDLSGQDVYRKALILARECGFSPQTIKFKPVLPEQLLQGDIDTFWQNQSAINAYIEALWTQAESQQQHLRYLATVNADEINVELVAVESDHAAVGLKPGDNIFIVQSDWYADNPLVIQGPGAGKEVTAAGVLNDLISVLRN